MIRSARRTRRSTRISTKNTNPTRSESGSTRRSTQIHGAVYTGAGYDFGHVLQDFIVHPHASRNASHLINLRIGQNHLQILEVRSLGQRNSLFVVEYRGRRLLIGSGNNGPRLLSALPDDGPCETSEGKEDSEICEVLETNAKGSRANFLSELNHHIGRESV